jgi:hypothetical protein
VYSRLSELREAGLAASAPLGWSCRRAARWWLTAPALAAAGVAGGSWHEEWGRCRLLERLPSVEWFYRVAGSLDGLGPLEAFQWLAGVSLDAAVRGGRGWAALFWSGLWQTEQTLLERLERLGPDLEELSVSGGPAKPGLLCFVVTDRWQRELVYRAVLRYRLEDSLAVWCVAGGARSGVREPGVSRGWVRQPAWPRGLGGWPWERRLADSFCSVPGGLAVGRVLEAAAEWPGMGLPLGRLALGEAGAARRVQNACKWLAGREFLERRLDGAGYRYALASRGIDLLARRDRVSYARSRGRSNVFSWQGRPRLQLHEDGVMSLMGEFMAAGLPAAAGWRSWEHLGGGGGIAPDGMVCLRRSPYGPGWHYVEYERSARGERRVRSKLRGYLSVRTAGRS